MFQLLPLISPLFFLKFRSIFLKNAIALSLSRFTRAASSSGVSGVIFRGLLGYSIGFLPFPAKALASAIEIASKKVISTIGAWGLDKIAPFIAKDKLEKIKALHYTKVIEVVLGFDKWEGMPLDAFGGLIPFKEKRDILGVLFMSALFGNRAPKGGELFSIFLAGVRRQEIYQMSDEQIKEILKREISDLMQLKTYKPDLLKIIRHEWAIPQYEADSGERFKAIEEIENEYKGLLIGGNLRNGIGMADRILQAKMLAEAVI